MSWCSVYAFDLIKSRIQATSARESPYRGWVDCAWKSYQAEGLGVFFKGLGATLSRAFVVNGAIFTMYEFTHGLLSHGSQQQKQQEQQELEQQDQDQQDQDQQEQEQLEQEQ